MNFIKLAKCLPSCIHTTEVLLLQAQLPKHLAINTRKISFLLLSLQKLIFFISDLILLLYKSSLKKINKKIHQKKNKDEIARKLINKKISNKRIIFVG